jgi:anti-sigma factor RsiW
MLVGLQNRSVGTQRVAVMFECEFQRVLDACHDGELDAPARRKVEAHAQTCTVCAAQLDAMRRLSGVIRSGAEARAAVDGPRADELARMHRAVSRAAREVNDRPLLRIAGAFSAVAASVLVISAVWLAALRGQGPINRPQRTAGPVAATEFPKTWEQVATGRYVPPVFLGNDQGYEPAEPALAYNNRELANYIYEGLSR